MAFQIHRNFWAIRYGLLVLVLVWPGVAVRGMGSAEPLALLYQKACYLQEMDQEVVEASKLFEELIQVGGPDRYTQAHARFRLAECYRHMDQDDRAQALLAELIAQFPEQQDVVQRALDSIRQLRREDTGRDRVGEVNEETWTGLSLELQPSPWMDRELLLYGLYSPTGEKIGLNFKFSRQDPDSEEPAWLVESLTDIPVLRHQQFTSYVASETNFRPKTGLSKSMGNSLRARFEDDRVLLGSVRGVEMKERREDVLPMSQQAFLLDQLFNLFRRMPLSNGYRKQLPILFMQGGIISQAEVVVEGEERIDVPHGSYDCYRVRCSFRTEGIPFADLTVWVAKEESHYLVKIQSSEMISLLDEVTPRRPEGTQRLLVNRYHLGLKVPEDWFLYDYPFGEQSLVSFKMVGEALSAEGIVVVSTILAEGSRKPARETLEVIGLNDLANMKAYLADLRELPDSRQYGLFQGYPAMRFVVGYENHGPYTEERLFILRENTLVRFMFRSGSDIWAEQRGQLGRLEDWLKVNPRDLEDWE